MTQRVLETGALRHGFLRRLAGTLGAENIGLLLALILVIAFFGSLSPRFLSKATFESVAFQLPELGLLTLAMLMPIISGGINLAVTFTANLCGLTLAWVLQANGGPDASIYAFLLGSVLAVGVGTASGLVMGPVIAYTGAHPILVSLSVMIFLRGLGEFLTRGADISGFPEFIQPLGHGSIVGIPVPLLILLGAVIVWHVLMTRTRLGFSNYMVGSNIEATRYSGISTRRVIILIYALSGAMCALAGIIMMARFNSVRVGHGESYVLITVLACFLGGVNPFGGFGKVVSVFLALIVLQLLSSGLNLLGASQHLATAIWGIMLIGVMILRWAAGQLNFMRITR
ncbi:ABC transporter permease [Mesorhizobium sp. M0761]|jgi:simple sugar transport system permease protein|uniref:ABC transporter permease n=1 Tax=unclassified Mesorhizobium TaxID=325217 RepID=UPI0003CF9184|nr:MULTISPECIES: ABC transporter permease [unclassified Mesorhizobium]ESW70204.1 ABC transporter permease [Mesorhizobium sp. LSJC277A00]ESW90308.1 ABC transporter permease [Mesorhizobium sp. LSJC285A00]ESW91852.1 ABC transporter permease [Mesorhizobium sp. LSJC269B00]ESX04400.1 ABC transporter permease [Mesorhizobium sp. LSJC268A00]ESX20107.1 ABC transporter permease [Mesorhizobium sp. LSJC255A00]